MSRTLTVTIIGNPAPFEAALGQSAAAASGFGARMEEMGAKVAAVGKRMTTMVTLPVVALGAVATKTAVDFQNSMELIHTQAGATQAQVDSMSASVLKLAGPVATAPKILSEGLYHLISQGIKPGAQAMDVLRVAAEGAKMGQANLEDVTNALGAVISSRIKGVHDYSQAMGEMNATVGAGDMRMQDLADAMGTGLPAKAAIFGVALDQVNAALAVFGDNNIRGAEAGTLLNSTIRIMGAPSKAAAKALAGIGIGATQLANDLRTGGLVKAVADLRGHLEGLSKAAQAQVLTRAFGGRQAGGVMILVDQFTRLQRKLEEVRQGGKKFEADWKSYTDTTAYHLASVGAAMQANGITIGDILLPVISRLTNFVSGLLSKFQSLSPGVRTAIVAFAGVAAVIGPVVSVIGTLATVIGAVASPIGIVVAALAVLVGGIVAAGLAPDKLKDALEHLGLSARQAGQVVAGLRDVFMVVKDAVEYVVSAVRAHWPEIESIVLGVFDIVKTYVTTWVAVVEALWSEFHSQILDVVKTEWNYVKDTVKNALTIIKGVVDVVTGLIHGRWSQVWKGIEEIVSGAFSQIENVLSTALHLLIDEAEAIGKGIWDGIIKPLLHLARDVWDKVTNAISSAVNGMLGWVFAEAKKLGLAIVHGAEAGLEGLPGALAHAVTHPFTAAFHAAENVLGINSPSRLFRDGIGKPIGEGIIIGYLEGIRPLPAHISSTLRQALEAGRHEVEQIVQTFRSAWSNLTQDANKAFDTINKTIKTKAGELLNSLQSVHNAADAKMNTITATAALSDARQAATTGTPDQQQAVADATTKLKIAQDHLTESQTKVQLAQDALNTATAKYGPDSDQATAAANALASAQDNLSQATMDLQTAQDNLTQAQADIPHQSDAVAAAFQKMQDAQDRLNAAIAKYGPASKQAVAAQKDLQAAMVGAQTVVSAEGPGAQQDKDQAVIDAQKNLDDIVYQEQVAALQKSQAAEEKAAKARLAARKLEMDQELKALEQHLLKEHATQEQAQKAIIKLLNSFGVSYKASGLALGTEFAKGLAQATGAAVAAIEQLAAEIAKFLPHSPADKGPLSRMPNWSNYLLPSLPGAVSDANSILGGLRAPTLSGVGGAGAAAAAGGGDLHVHAHFDGPVVGGIPADVAQKFANAVEPYIVRRRYAMGV
jgi:TP901 family phage tail tape measure protein